MFSGKDVPAVGVSIGIERVFAIMEQQAIDRAKQVMREQMGMQLGNRVQQVPGEWSNNGRRVGGCRLFIRFCKRPPTSTNRTLSSRAHRPGRRFAPLRRRSWSLPSATGFR